MTPDSSSPSPTSTPAPDTTIEAPVPAPPAQPVTQKHRVISIDVLRGFAVLGILAMNIQIFAMPGISYANPTSFGDRSPININVWYINHVLFDMKMMTIFSMLFGAGIIIFTERARQKTGRSAAVHYRRTAWLILFGLLHAHLLWYGDILYTYGMCALFLYLLRNLRPSLLIGLGVLALAVPLVINQLFELLMTFKPEYAMIDAQQRWAGVHPEIEREVSVYRDGPWISQLARQSSTAFFFQTIIFLIVIVWRAAGVMLLGMAMHKLKIFSAQRSTVFYFIMLVLGLLIGLPLVLAGVQHNFAIEWAYPDSKLTGTTFNYVGSLFVACAWVAAIMLLCKTALIHTLLRPFAAAGQMALTNYLMQTIICTTVFYHYGFGLFGELQRWQLAIFVAGVWLLELIWSPIWLHFFRFGPFEWVWRSLTYWQPQPLRRAHP